jgi:hydroxypyruvate reductase
MLEDAGEEDLVIALISGGASALMEMPAGRVPLIDIQSATGALLSSGARIEEMNAVRKHLSKVKGGGLARMAAPARVLSLILSDVVGSPLDVIASGPTVPDESTYADAAAVISRYGLWNRMPASVGDHLREGMAGQKPETPKTEEEVNALAVRVIGSNRVAARAAMQAAEALGYQASLVTTYLDGEAREAGRFLAALGKEAAAAQASGDAPKRPICFVVGGETTVTLRRLGGTGGRNQELALGAALSLDDPRWAGVTVAAMGTDGIDGPTEAAGALVDASTVKRAAEAGLNAGESLQGHDSATFFAALGDAIVTGPTGTNVNDLALVLIQ